MRETMKMRIPVKKEIWLNILWIVISIGLFALISFINVSRFTYLNFSDPSSEMFEYFKAIIDEGKLIPSNWINSNELLIRRNIFTALPIYALTKNLLLTYQINSVITNGVLVFTCIYMLKGIGVKGRYIPVAVALFLGMFSYGDAQTLLFVTQGYAIYVMVVLITLLKVSEPLGSNISTKSMIVLCIMAVYMGIIGVKMTLMLYVPLVFVETLIYIATYLKEQSLLNSRSKHFLKTIVLFCFNGVGLLIFAGMFSKYTSDAYYSFNMLPLVDVLPNFYKQIVAFLSSLSVDPNGVLKSFRTIDSLFKALIVLVGIGEMIYFIKRNIYTRTRYIILVLSSSIVISMICMALADFRISSRYYFLAPLTFSILLTCLYNQIFDTKFTELKIFTVVILMCGIGLTCMTYYRHYVIGYIEEGKQWQLAEVEKLRDKKIDTVFASRWNANCLSGFSNGALDTGNITFGDFKPFKFLTNISHYQKQDDIVINLTDFQENLIIDNNLPSKRFLNKGKKIADIGGLNVYYYSQNPLAGFIFPDEVGKKTNFNLGSIDCKIVNGKLDVDKERIISNYMNENREWQNMYVNREMGEWEIVLGEPIESPDSVVMYGPGADVKDGEYRITLNYSVLNSDIDVVGSFSVTSNNKAKIIKTVELQNNKEEGIVVLDVSLQNAKAVDFVVKRNEGSQISVNSIEVEKMR